MITRRKFVKKSSMGGSALLAAAVVPFYILPSKPKLGEQILGHGDFKYKAETQWGNLDPKTFPVNNCHEMVMDKKGRLLMLTDHPKNNMLIYDKSGKLLQSWTLHLSSAHGLTIHEAGGEEYLYITDPGSERVLKCTLQGRVVFEFEAPEKIGAYNGKMPYRPTETTIGPNGDVYVADGYGSQYILQYSAQGEFIRKFGGDSFLQLDKFKQVHGVTLDTRDPANPTLLCTARIKNSFK
ncbi:MAG: twin-arginine translocation signal domain-containing protein, partial [Arenibacter sp.]